MVGKGGDIQIGDKDKDGEILFEKGKNDVQRDPDCCTSIVERIEKILGFSVPVPASGNGDCATDHIRIEGSKRRRTVQGDQQNGQMCEGCQDEIHVD